MLDEQTLTTTARGTRQDQGALKGGGLLQSPHEWEARNRQLASSFGALIGKYLVPRTGCALDVGCMDGELTDRYAEGHPLSWWGIDPDVAFDKRSAGGAQLSRGFGHELAFPDSWFDCITFANVYEHLPPTLRGATLAEMYRVLAPGGIVVGQLPNPYFPIESHSRLPFLGCLPRFAQRWYWRLTPTGWDFDKAHFFSVTVHNVCSTARAQGLEVVEVRDFNYEPEAIPASVRWAARVHARLGIMPWAWQFVLRKPASRIN